MRRTVLYLLTALAVSWVAAAGPARAGEARFPVDLEQLFSELECPFGPCGIGENFGGAVTGVTTVGVLCRNITTGESFVVPSIADSWDCETLGLTVRTGDLVATAAAGIADLVGGQSFGGSVRGVTPVGVLCLNLVTGDRLTVPSLASSWNCEALGLPVSPGHLVVTGAAGIALPFP